MPELLRAIVASVLAGSPALAFAQPCAARASYRFAQSLCEQSGTGEIYAGTNAWITTIPLTLSASNTNTNPTGCMVHCEAVSYASYDELTFVASGNGNNCPPCGAFMWIDEYYGGFPKAEIMDRISLSSQSLPNGTPAEVRITMTFQGGGQVNDPFPYYTQGASVTAKSYSYSLASPGTVTFVVDATVGSSFDLHSQLFCTMRAQGLAGGSAQSASFQANLRAVTTATVLTPGVTATRCDGDTPCLSDFNGDEFSDAIDYDQFIAAWVNSDPSSDVNADGFSDAIDYDLFISHWVAGC